MPTDSSKSQLHIYDESLRLQKIGRVAAKSESLSLLAKKRIQAITSNVLSGSSKEARAKKLAQYEQQQREQRNLIIKINQEDFVKQLPQRYASFLDSDFKNFRIHQGNREAFSLIKSIRRGEGVYLQGLSGVGKTFIAIQICKTLIQLGLSVAYYGKERVRWISKQNFDALPDVSRHDVIFADDLDWLVGRGKSEHASTKNWQELVESIFEQTEQNYDSSGKLFENPKHPTLIATGNMELSAFMAAITQNDSKHEAMQGRSSFIRSVIVAGPNYRSIQTNNLGGDQ